MADTGFSEKMCCVLRELRPDLIKKMIVNDDLLAHLISKNVFQTDEYILAERTRSAQVRKLLDDLQRRPAADFWNFVLSLYETAQGHVAELILQKYETRSGAIPADIQRRRQDHQYSHEQQQHHNMHPPPQNHCPPQQNHRPPQQTHRPPQQHHGQQQPQQLRQQPQSGMEVDDAGDGPGVSLYGNMLSQSSGDASENQVLDHDDQQTLRFTVGLGGSNSEQADSRQPELHQDAESDDVISLTAYLRARELHAIPAYKMESDPRGQLLVINNECFEHLDNRDGTQQDCDVLVDVFENKLGFETKVLTNCTAQEMLDELCSFAEQLEDQEVDSCAVAIMSHGGEGDIIFGSDGQVNVQGTYITMSDLRNIFSASGCPAMRKKPKLFIIQACRGVLEDNRAERQPYHRDTLPDNPADAPPGPSSADRYILNATVENYVAYRGRFIQLLAKVLRDHADTLHIKDMATKLHNEMSNIVVGTHTFTISEERGTLTKHWFLNPPATQNT